MSSLRPFFDPFEDLSISSRRPVFRMNTDVHETDDSWTIETELPGVPKENVQVEVSGNELIISGQREHEEERTGRRSIYKEREYGKFSRRFALPSESDPSKIECKMNHGILTVKVAKSQSQSPPRRRLPIQ
ncbi:hypothetical protein RCL1_008164 [Eukaryota sp. TZLM3-RCL]